MLDSGGRPLILSDSLAAERDSVLVAVEEAPDRLEIAEDLSPGMLPGNLAVLPC